MANCVASARSNYFHVKDKELFIEKFINRLGLTLIERDDRVGFMTEGENGIPHTLFPENWPDEQDEDIDFDLELSQFLEEGSVAIYTEIVQEKMRYLMGYSVAVNSKGETKVVSLQDIYDKAKELTTSEEIITVCEY